MRLMGPSDFIDFSSPRAEFVDARREKAVSPSVLACSGNIIWVDFGPNGRSCSDFQKIDSALRSVGKSEDISRRGR